MTALALPSLDLYDSWAASVAEFGGAHVDGAAIGRRAAQMIIARCNDQPVAQPVVDLGFRIVERQST